MLKRDLTPAEYAAALDRIKEATGCRTQVELSACLGIRQSSVSDAGRRHNIPAAWLLALLEKYGLAPGWILTGQGPRYLVGSDAPGEHAPGHWTTPEPPAPEPRTVAELKAAIEAQLPGCRIFIAYGDPQALDLGGLRALAESPAGAGQ